MNTTALRLTLATLLAASVVYSVMPHATGYVSSSAVVNAPLINVTAPYNGVIETPSKRITQPVLEGDKILDLRRSEGQTTEVLSLSTQVATISGEIAGLEKQSKDLQALNKSLEIRRQARVDAKIDWYKPKLDEARANLKKSQVNLERIEDTAQRVQTLSAKGSVSESDYTNVLADVEIAKSEVALQQAVLDRLMVEHSTLSHADSVDLNSNSLEQIEYRLDEIAVRRADLDARLLRLQTQKAGLKTQISKLNNLTAIMDKFSPRVSTKSGIIWNRSPAAGTAVSSGDLIAQILNCNSRFLEVEIQERHFENIPPGARAWVQFKGSEKVFPSSVIVSYGSAAKPNRSMEFAAPRLIMEQGLRVLVRLPKIDVADEIVARSFCDVGRSADVQFELSDDNIFSKALRYIRHKIGMDMAEDESDIAPVT